MDIHITEQQKNLIAPIAIICVAGILVWVSPIAALLVTFVALAAFSVWTVSRSLMIRKNPRIAKRQGTPARKGATAPRAEQRSSREVKQDAEKARVGAVAWLPFLLLLGMVPLFLVIYMASQ